MANYVCSVVSRQQFDAYSFTNSTQLPLNVALLKFMDCVLDFQIRIYHHTYTNLSRQFVKILFRNTSKVKTHN